MRNNEDFIVIPCDCADLDHAMIYTASQFQGGDNYIVIRFPLYHENKNPLTRFNNIRKGRFEFTFNITLEAAYFPLVEYFWKISFPGKTFEYEVWDNDPHWKLYFIQSKLTLGFRLPIEKIVYYLRYGVIEYPFEIFIDKDGPSASRYEKIY